jgi:3D-(3,5/4)-trihydroxycyclohexane-1,2-dione acylhydrolase (decyclizing)
MRGNDGQLSGPELPFDFAASAKGLGAEVVEARTADDLQLALRKAKANTRTTVICVEIESQARFGGSGAWWDVAVAEVATIKETREARKVYEAARTKQRPYLDPSS